MKTSWYMYEGVMVHRHNNSIMLGRHLRMRHGTHMNESWHTHMKESWYKGITIVSGHTYE